MEEGKREREREKREERRWRREAGAGVRRRRRARTGSAPTQLRVRAHARGEVKVDFAKVRINFFDAHKVSVRLGEEVALADDVVDPDSVSPHLAGGVLGGARVRWRALRSAE